MEEYLTTGKLPKNEYNELVRYSPMNITYSSCFASPRTKSGLLDKASGITASDPRRYLIFRFQP
jgi:hypothetical protein